MFSWVLLNLFKSSWVYLERIVINIGCRDIGYVNWPLDWFREFDESIDSHSPTTSPHEIIVVLITTVTNISLDPILSFVHYYLHRCILKSFCHLFNSICRPTFKSLLGSRVNDWNFDSANLSNDLWRSLLILGLGADPLTSLTFWPSFFFFEKIKKNKRVGGLGLVGLWVSS